MLNINPQYLVDDKGQKTSVLLSIKEYQHLMQCLEDLEDILEMDAAVRTETDFRDYRDVQDDLIKEGKF
ncbi:hypothetical protein C6500_02800 [Candidatus Poribacteria bacterium]|nr:MAG: hypothetical protein C6500_02800 [Candidatus Poribacteria bacterium]